MTNNPTIDGVSRELRELLERVARPIMKRRDETVSRRAISELRALLDAPFVERQPVALIEWSVNKPEWALTMLVEPSIPARTPFYLYDAPPEVAALQSANKRLTETIQHLIDQTIPLVPDENNPMWSRRITIDELQSTIAQLQARVQELESARGEPVAWAVFTDKGNIRIWSRDCKATGLIVEAEEGRPAVPLFTAQPAPVAVVPDGWKLVPVEPTAEMLENLAADIYPDDKKSGLQLQRLRGTNVVFPKHEIEMAVGKYARMLEVAPACLEATAALNGAKK